MSASLLDVRDLDVRYGGINALRGVSLHASAGEIVALLGANGAGKSTCLRAISGLVRPHAGAVLLDGQPIHTRTAEAITHAGVAHVPEHRRIFSTLTVADNLLLGAYVLGRSGRRARLAERLDFVHGLFPRLADRRRQLGGTLSGGEQQMLAIGRALMSAPRLLLMDEPSLGLAPLVVETIFASLTRLRGEGLSVVLVEQFAHSALEVADRAYVLKAGALVLEGPASDLALDPRLLESYLGTEARADTAERSPA